MVGNSKILEAALGEFLDECSEMLERFSRGLGSIEKGEQSTDLYASIYRDMHTIKGNSQLFGFPQIGQMAHAMETCLDQTRKGIISMTPSLADTLYCGMDIIAMLLQGIRQNNKEPDKTSDLKQVIPRLVEIAEFALIGHDPSVKNVQPPMAEEDGAEVLEQKTKYQNNSVSEIRSPEITWGSQMDENKSAPVENVGWGMFEEPVNAAAAPASLKISNPDPAPDPQPIAKQDDVQPKAAGGTAGGGGAGAGADDNHAETIRVHVTLLDSLMNLVGELVLIRNQLLQHARNNDDDSEFSQVSQRLNVLTAELQTEVMKTRMQPIGNILTKFKRVVRDVGRDLGKNIDLQLEGVETELDKTIIEAVKDPLTHIVRNGIDHGIETASERIKAGKPEIGHIVIRSYHESGQVIIQISDDGKGLERQRIGNRAVERGLITQEAFAKMTDREVQFLIFSPGFSTATVVSNISGRGVGMDVVKTNVERIGGVVDLISKPGHGTTIKLKIPLTLAIVPALIVKSMNQRFAIPQTKLVELLRIETSGSGAEKIEMLQGQPVFRLRGRLLPLLSLAEILHGPRIVDDQERKGESRFDSGVMNIAVLNADGMQFGLLVDEIEDSSDIVVKSLSPFLKDISVFSGASIMGDGAVALTIDVLGIASKARLVNSNSNESQGAPLGLNHKPSTYQADACEYLLVDIGGPGSYGIPLTVVSRLEEFEVSRVELSGEQPVVRYRESLLPLLSLPKFLGIPPVAKGIYDQGHIRVVVIRRGDRYYGIEVSEILDVITVEAKIDQTICDRNGILGTLIYQDRVIVIADILSIIDEMRKKTDIRSGQKGDASAGKSSERTKYTAAMRRQHKILIVEDSSFFRNYIRQVVEEAGFQCEVAYDGADGLAHLEKYPPGYFSIVLSDIEMPVLDGLGLVRKIRAIAAFSKLPVIAITTRFSNDDVALGMEAGFNSYLEKLNAEVLLAELDEILIPESGVKGAKYGTSV